MKKIFLLAILTCSVFLNAAYYETELKVIEEQVEEDSNKKTFQFELFIHKVFGNDKELILNPKINCVINLDQSPTYKSEIFFGSEEDDQALRIDYTIENKQKFDFDTVLTITEKGEVLHKEISKLRF